MHLVAGVCLLVVLTQLVNETACLGASGCAPCNWFSLPFEQFCQLVREILMMGAECDTQDGAFFGVSDLNSALGDDVTKVDCEGVNAEKVFNLVLDRG
jgi:hypothetical protein